MLKARVTARCLAASVLTIASLVTAGERPYPDAPAWVADQTLYEVNLRQFSPTGDVAGLRQQLPRLKALGVGTLWIMPVQPIGETARSGKLGSPYAPRSHTQFNPEFGTLADFKAMVAEAHRLGLRVIIDWVAVHTSPDHAWVTQHPDWYKRDAAGGLVPPVPAWKDVVALDYAAPGLRRAMVDAMAFWVRETDIDGFRCDTAEWVPTEVWTEARDTLRRIKPVFLLAEGNDPKLMDYAFDAAYAWPLPENTEGIVGGAKRVPDLINYLNADAKLLPANAFRLNYTTNHDKNAWEGTTREKLKDAADAFTVLTFTIPGMPLIYNGQETGHERRLNFFDKDPIAWQDDPAADLYRTLAKLKRDHRALHTGPHASPLLDLKAQGANDTVLTYRRTTGSDRVVVLLNLAPTPARVPTPAGLAGMKPVLGPAGATTGAAVELPAWGYCVWASAVTK